MYSASHEKERKERETPERILAIARTKGSFTVSLRYRDDWLRRRCSKLKREGLLVGGRRQGRILVFYPAAQGTGDRSMSAVERGFNGFEVQTEGSAGSTSLR